MVMTKRLYDNLDKALYRVKKLTSKAKTGSVYVTKDMFPLQKNSIIGTDVYVNFKKESASFKSDGSTVIYETNNCKVLRCDTTEPYTFIGWIRHTATILVGDSRNYNTSVLREIPQENNMLLYSTENFYETGVNRGSVGIIVRCDNMEPDKVILCEFYQPGIVRFVNADETTVLLTDYIPDQAKYRKVTTNEFIESMESILGSNSIYKSTI